MIAFNWEAAMTGSRKLRPKNRPAVYHCRKNVSQRSPQKRYTRDKYTENWDQNRQTWPEISCEVDSVNRQDRLLIQLNQFNPTLKHIYSSDVPDDWIYSEVSKKKNFAAVKGCYWMTTNGATPKICKKKTTTRCCSRSQTNILLVKKRPCIISPINVSQKLLGSTYCKHLTKWLAENRAPFLGSVE